MDALRRTSRPEFLNRIDEIVTFRSLATGRRSRSARRLRSLSRRKERRLRGLRRVRPRAQKPQAI